jgi:hypothetical protein
MDEKFAKQFNAKVDDNNNNNNASVPVESYNAPPAPAYGAPQGYGAVPQQ